MTSAPDKRPQRWWDTWFSGLARHVATAGKPLYPSSQAGAVIVDDKRRIVSLGYNGLPRGLPDNASLLHDRHVKLACAVHAEANALLHARRDLTGHTMYTWPFPPCSQCAALIIQSGITRVVSPDRFPERWKHSFRTGQQIMEMSGVGTVLLPEEDASPEPVSRRDPTA